MPELLHDIDIVNRALSRIGGGVILDLEGEGELEQQANLIFATEVEWALGQFPWPFSRKSFKLGLKEQNPASGYGYSHSIPGGVLGGPLHLRHHPKNPNATIRDFEIEAGEIHTDFKEVWARFMVRTEPELWIPQFRKAIIVGVASALAVPLAHDVQLAAALKAEAYGSPQEAGRGGLLGAAINACIGSAPPQETVLSEDPLTQARWGE